MADVTLSAAVRSSLLSLQGTTDLIDRTQGRLSSGLRVSGPIDDPVAFFQAKSLDDRSFDFSEKKDKIDQGISTLSAALDGVNAIESLVRQLKGVGNSMKSASAAQFTDLITQYNDLRTQIDNLASDATYQGTNLVGGTGQNLTVEFSDLTAAQLTVASVDITVATGGLDVGQAVLYTAGAAYASIGASTGFDTVSNTSFVGVSATGSISMTWEGGATTFTAGASMDITYGTQTLSVTNTTGTTLAQGDVITVNVDTAAATTGYSINTSNDYVDAGVINNATTGVDSGGTITLTWAGADATTTTSDSYTVSIGSAANAQDIVISFNTAGVAGGTLTAGETFTLTLASAGGETGAYAVGATVGTVTAITAGSTGGLTTTATNGLSLGQADIAAETVTNKYVSAGDTVAVNSAIAELDTALTTLRTQAASLGSNVALLQTRLTFTESYVNTLDEGSSKLTLADLNSEGANLLALQTRQQLGIQALAFAGQAEQAILRLFG